MRLAGFNETATQRMRHPAFHSATCCYDRLSYELTAVHRLPPRILRVTAKKICLKWLDIEGGEQVY